MTRSASPVLALLVAACSAAVPSPGAAPSGLPSSVTQASARAVVQRIDHVMILTNDRERLEALLSDTLQLPIVWPRPGSQWTSSTGLALGDVNLELMPRRNATDTQLGDFAFQPVDLASASDHLRERGLNPREPGGYTDSAGVKRWSIIGFRHSFEGIAFFLVQYHQFDMDQRRTEFEQRLRERKGGPLGLRRVREFRLAYPADSLPLALQSWERLLGPAAGGASGRFLPSAGPAVRLIAGSSRHASSLLIEVESLTAAEAAARSLRLFLSASRDSVLLDPLRFGGLRLVLVER